MNMTQLKIFNLEDIGDSNPVCTLPKGEHVVGRGPTLNISDKRVSRSHAQIIVSDQGAIIKSIHINPCFFKSSAGRHIQILNRNDTIEIGDGDTFSLLAEKYWYRVRVEFDQSNEDKPEAMSNKRYHEESSPGPSKRKKSDDNNSVYVSLSSPNHPKMPTRAESAPSSPDFCEPINEFIPESAPPSPDFCDSMNEEFIAEMVGRQVNDTINNSTTSNSNVNEEVDNETAIKQISDNIDKSCSAKIPLKSSSPIVQEDIKAKDASPIKIEDRRENSPTTSTSNSHVKPEAPILADDCSHNSEPKDVLSSSDDTPELICMPFVDITNDEVHEESNEGTDYSKRKAGLSEFNENPEITWSMDETADIKDIELQAQAVEQSNVEEDKEKEKEANVPGVPVTVLNADGDQGAGTSSTNTTPSTSRRERCWYGASCYRKNMQHRSDFSHPGDADYNSDPNDNRPECPFGTACYRVNRDHRMQYKHSNKPAPKPKRPVQTPGNVADDDSSDESNSTDNGTTANGRKQRKVAAKKPKYTDTPDDDYDFDDPFINDASSDDFELSEGEDESTDEESQNVDDEDTEDKKRLLRDAKKFLKKDRQKRKK